MTRVLTKFLVVKLAKVAKRHSAERMKKLELLKRELELSKRILREQRHKHVLDANTYMKYLEDIDRIEKIIEKKEFGTFTGPLP